MGKVWSINNNFGENKKIKEKLLKSKKLSAMITPMTKASGN